MSVCVCVCVCGFTVRPVRGFRIQQRRECLKKKPNDSDEHISCKICIPKTRGQRGTKNSNGRFVEIVAKTRELRVVPVDDKPKTPGNMKCRFIDKM